MRIFIDFDSVPRAIQPIYLTSAQTVFSHLDNWSPWKFPREIGYIDGQRPPALGSMAWATRAPYTMPRT